ncbi:ABC transporter permease [Roseicyclus sp. F158]|uniref:ABC transporter permease n=1 Tax=Tropicimonas omnivorans TaxID=3075590 RepID=A0ABU3DBG8_9RHOB|nr:ABC transporter permease [Roseicyclus sp. F158]MDT0681064.1 ABC transporter permease [Roseicyclus sp. F158]
MRVIGAMMLREMATSYGRSPGGWLWAVAEPVAAITLLSLLFSMAFRAPALGQNFPLFYATGYLPFMLFSDVSTKIGAALRFSKPLLAYPRVTWIDAILGRFFLNLLTHLLVTCVVMAGIAGIYGVPGPARPGALLNALGMASALALGVGTLNCFLLAMLPAWDRIWQIATRPLFIVSGIFFLFEAVPERYAGALWFNPLIHVTAEFRSGAYAGYAPDWVSAAFVYGVAAGAFALGLILLRRHSRDIMARL